MRLVRQSGAETMSRTDGRIVHEREVDVGDGRKHNCDGYKHEDGLPCVEVEGEFHRNALADGHIYSMSDYKMS